MKTLSVILLLAASLSAAPCTNCTITGAADFRIAGNKSPDAVMSFGSKMTFAFDVANGDYEVTMRFMEANSPWKAGGRIFYVTINDQPLLWAFDVYAAAGTSPTQRVLFKSVSDGRLVVGLTSMIAGGNAIVSSIVVKPKPPTVPGPVFLPRQRGLTTTRGNPKTLTLSGGGVQVGGVFIAIPPCVINAISGTGQVRIALDTSTSMPSCKATAGLSAVVTYCISGNCAQSMSVDSFAPGDIQLAVWNMTSGTFDDLGGTDLVGDVSFTQIDAANGINSTIVGGKTVLSLSDK